MARAARIARDLLSAREENTAFLHAKIATARILRRARAAGGRRSTGRNHDWRWLDVGDGRDVILILPSNGTRHDDAPAPDTPRGL
jgi:hypothetical protein